MKKIVYIIFLATLCSLGFSEVNMTVCIILRLSPLYGGGEIEIYNGTYSRIENVMKEIENAKKITLNHVIKEALIEGEYFIVVTEKNVEIKSYVVFNSQNVYDLKKDRYLKCNVLSEVYRICVEYFLKERMKK